MEPMAKAIWLTYERSNLFIEFFSKGMSGEDYFACPEGTANPAIWIYGHLAYHRAYLLELLTGKKINDDEATALFGMGCEPVDYSAYPSIEASRALMLDRLQEIGNYLETATQADLELAPYADQEYFETKLAALVHLTLHEAHHTGCLSALRRRLGKERII
jgi:hypothetical protein